MAILGRCSRNKRRCIPWVGVSRWVSEERVRRQGESQYLSRQAVGRTMTVIGPGDLSATAPGRMAGSPKAGLCCEFLN